MSEGVERRLVEVLDHPTTSPYGNPIPGLADLGSDQIVATAADLIRLTDVAMGSSVAVVVRRISEHVQTDIEVMGQLRQAGVVPDARVTVRRDGAGVTITVAGHAGAQLPLDMAHAVQAEPV